MSNKTPDEIKKGLEYCFKGGNCGACPYNVDVFSDDCMEELSRDLKAHIEQLEAQVPKWISVEERLPEEVKRDDEEASSTDIVIVAVRDDMNNIFVSDDILCKGEWVNYSAPLFEVTHWMPLPELPKEDEHGAEF